MAHTVFVSQVNHINISGWSLISSDLPFFKRKFLILPYSLANAVVTAPDRVRSLNEAGSNLMETTERPMHWQDHQMGPSIEDQR